MLVLPLAWLVASCATYSGKPGSATVVDAATARPLGGVVVAASWNYIDTQAGEFAGVFYMTDAVTDEHGEFVLPAWGPRGITPERVLRETCSDADRPLAVYLD